MIYSIALLLSVAVCAQSVAISIVSGNLVHVKNGRPPDAGVSLFPMIPFFQLVAAGIAWGLERYIPDMALGALLGGYVVLSAFWLVSYKKAKAEFDRISIATRPRAGKG